MNNLIDFLVPASSVCLLSGFLYLLSESSSAAFCFWWRHADIITIDDWSVTAILYWDVFCLIHCCVHIKLVAELKTQHNGRRMSLELINWFSLVFERLTELLHVCSRQLSANDIDWLCLCRRPYRWPRSTSSNTALMRRKLRLLEWSVCFFQSFGLNCWRKRI